MTIQFTLVNGKPTIDRDPDNHKDYVWDMTDKLDAGDTLAAVVFTPEEGSAIDVTASSHTDTTATAWLQHGTLDDTFGVTCHYTTTGGREDDLTLYFRHKQQ